ncbi:hypothetical protein [Roseovarius sp. Pro17]|uniref:hypothetical protein n=1 Tax=Roseovarius sp. Pro17 TaxID=3108175 RepID=UPI002D772A90|nr:hypothetical protein [Roseovarius sp. Pro17]
MTAGDLVEFDLRDGGDMRLADAPRLVMHDSHPTLSSDLKRAGVRLGVLPEAAPRAVNTSHSANVIPLREARVAAYA